MAGGQGVAGRRQGVLDFGARRGRVRRLRGSRIEGSEIAAEARVLEVVRRLGEGAREGVGGRLDELRGELASGAGDSSSLRLFEDVEAFARSLEAGDYFEGWGWDPELSEERAWGDESWAGVMDALLERCAEAFEGGERAVTAECYGRLLRLLTRDMDEGVFCGSEPAPRMLRTNLDEARARYLRCVYETAAPSSRAEVLEEAMAELDGLGGPVGLQALMDVDSAPLPGFEAFLAAWLRLLAANARTRAGGRLFEWESAGRWLLSEARQLERGVDGLARLARERGASHPEAYHQWIRGLLRSGDEELALAAAREGAAAAVDGEARAQLAEVQGRLADVLGRPVERVEARRRAFRAAPTPRRLAAFLAASSGAGECSRDERRERLREEVEQALVTPLRYPPRVLALLDVLLGRFEASLVTLESSPRLGWSAEEHPGRVIFPTLLRLCVLGGLPEESVLGRLWRQLDRMLGLRAEPRQLVFEACGLELPAAPPMSAREWIEDEQRAATWSDARRLALLEALRAIAWERVCEIVSRKHRGAYERAAIVAVATAEALALAHQREAAEDLLARLHEEFPKHRAFRRELRMLEAASALALSQS